MLCQPTQHPFLSALSVVIPSSQLAALKKIRFVGDEIRMQTLKTELLQINFKN